MRSGGDARRDSSSSNRSQDGSRTGVTALADLGDTHPLTSIAEEVEGEEGSEEGSADLWSNSSEDESDDDDDEVEEEVEIVEHGDGHISIGDVALGIGRPIAPEDEEVGVEGGGEEDNNFRPIAQMYIYDDEDEEVGGGGGGGWSTAENGWCWTVDAFRCTSGYLQMALEAKSLSGCRVPPFDLAGEKALSV